MKKFKRNREENCKWIQEDYGNIIGKNWSNLKLMLYYNELLKSFSNISVKFGKNWKNIGNTSYKVLKHLEENCEILKANFWKTLRDCRVTSNNFREKLLRNLEEVLDAFEALLKICPAELQSLNWHWIQAHI